jgi:hypothetical protein
MKNLPLLALALAAAPQVASADEPKDLLATVTTAHVLPSVRSAEALARKLSPTTAEIKLEAMANVVFGLDRAMAEAFEGPVDLAVLKDAAGSVGGGAIAMGWKDPGKLRGVGMADLRGVRSVPIDATPVLPQIASAASATEAACALYPSTVAPGQRLVCGTTPAALAALGDYLANDVAREERPSDVAMRFPIGVLVGAAERDGSLQASLHKAGENEAQRLAADEVIALGRDTTSGSVGVGWDAEALALAFELRFGGRSAATSRLLMSASDHGRTLPEFFERLPADTYAFGTLGGFDPNLAREAAQKAVDLAAGEVPADAQIGITAIRPLVDAIASRGFACSFATGLDAKRALPAVEALKKKRTDATYEKASRAIAPWFALEADGLEEGAVLFESVMKLSDTNAPFPLAAGVKWPAGTRAWNMGSGGVIAAMPRAGALVVLYASDGALLSEKLKAFAGLPGTRAKLAEATRDAFRDRPAGVFVATDRVGDVFGLSIDEDSVDGALKTLREDVKRKDAPVQIPMTMSVRAASEKSGWQGSLRFDVRYPVKALQAVSKGAKKLSPGGLSL